MKRSFKIFLLLISTFVLFNINEVKADDVRHGYSESFYNDCVDNHTCYILCAYTNKVRYTSEVVEAKYNRYSSYIYYDIKSNNFFVEWLSGEASLNLARNNANFGKNYVHIEDDVLNNLKNYGKCPSNSYIDIANFSVSPEVCFSNNSSYCIEDMRNAGTKFTGESSKEYDYETHVNEYFKTWSPNFNNNSCDDLKNQNIDIEGQYVTDYSTNFLYGNSIPEFMKNSVSFNEGYKTIDKRIDNFKTKCINEEKNKLSLNQITQSEYDLNIQKIESAANKLKGQLDSANETINQGTNNDGGNISIDEIENCESLLGDPNKKEPTPSPAWYLSFIFSIIRYVAIILLIVLTIIDFVGATASQDNDAIKKVVSKTIKRAIICVVIFVLPTLIDLVLQFIHDSSVSDCIKNI